MGKNDIDNAWVKLNNDIINTMIKEYPKTKQTKNQQSKEELREEYMIKNADYTLFGLHKERESKKYKNTSH